MKYLAQLLFSLVLAGAAHSLWAAPELPPEEKVPIDVFEMENGYVFESDLNHGGSFGKQYEIQNEFEYTHRFHLTENYYVRAGVAYSRFDFGETAAPVPEHLQSLAALIGVDYMQGADIGALLQFRPGIYTETEFRSEAFDCPITLARFWVLQPDKFYLLTGVNYSFLRGGTGTIPIVGFVWYPAEKIKIMGIVPEPRAIYSPNEDLELWIGGQIAGGSFRTDQHDEYVGPHVAKLSGTQVDYSDYRAGAGFNWNLTKAISVGAAGGCAIERAFKYHRAGENYRTDPAPYVKIEVKALF